MAFQYWHLAVVAAVVALVVWGLVAARRKALAVLAAALVLISGWLYYTLIVDEGPYIEHSFQDVALIGLPAVIGLGLGVLAARRASGPV
jgi:hypothetical protein